MKTPTIVLIAGGTCSGKSVFARWFTQSVLVSLDSFYLNASDVERYENGECRWDDPSSVNLSAAANAIVELKNKRRTIIPIYDFKTNKRTGTQEIRLTKDTRFIIVEGMHALHTPLLELGDMKIFLDMPSEIRVARRMLRDTVRKGRSYLETLASFMLAEEAYNRFVEPTKKYADLIIPFSHNPIEFLK